MNEPTDETGDLDARRKKALNNCEARIVWYERNTRRSQILFRTSQSAVVILGALSPVLILLPGVPEAVQALPAALAAIPAGVGGFWRWQDNWVRFAYTAEALKGERI